MRWFSRDWYEYLFSYLDDCENFTYRLKRIYCRIRRHELGKMVHRGSITALEPDYHCSYCDDEM